jgi:hypothetical protein
MRGNQHGAHTLLRRGAGRISRYDDPHRGIGVHALAVAALGHADEIEDAERHGRPSPKLDFPKV